MDSLSNLLDRLRPNDKDFKQRFIDITSVYNAPFDSDHILQFLKEETLFNDDKDNWMVLIPEIQFNVTKKEYIIPDKVVLYPDLEIPFPETLEEFRSMAKAYGLTIRLNSETANMIYGF